LSKMRLSGAGMLKMLLCCCWVHEAAGGPPGVCVMEARDGVSSLGIVVLAPGPLLYQQLALGGLCRAGGECLDAASVGSSTLNLTLNPESILIPCPHVGLPLTSPCLHSVLLNCSRMYSRKAIHLLWEVEIEGVMHARIFRHRFHVVVWFETRVPSWSF
jgi:hypothetical protein